MAAGRQASTADEAHERQIRLGSFPRGEATGAVVVASGGYHWMLNCSVPRRQLRRSTLAPVIVFFGSSSHAWAQGTHDWGMWFCTLVVIGALAALVFFLITLVRWLMR